LEGLKIKQLVNNLAEGFAHIKILRNKKGNAEDYLFIDVNQQFSELMNYKKDDFIGKKATEVFEGIKEHDLEWIDIFAESAEKGLKKEFQKYSNLFNRWFKIRSYSPEDDQLVIFITDLEKEAGKSTDAELFDREKGKLNYQITADKVKEMSGAKYAFLNIYKKNEDLVQTVSISGSSSHIQKAVSMIGIDLVGWRWKPALIKNKRLMNEDIPAFNSLDELSKNVVPSAVIKKLESIFSLGKTYILKLEANNEIIGYFILVMHKNKELNNSNSLKKFAGQIAVILESIENKDKLNKTQERLKLAVDAAEQSFWEYDLDNDKLYFSPNHYKMLGYKPGELSQDPEENLKLVHPDDRYKLKNAESKLRKKPGKFDIELRFQRKNNGWIWFREVGKAYDIDKDGRPHSIVGILIKIERRKKQEQQLKQSRQKFSELAEHAPIGILSCDRDGNIDYINSKVAEIMGSPGIEKTKEINLLEFPLLKKNNISEKIERSMQKNTSGTYEINYITKWGKKVWVRLHITPIKGTNGVKGAQIIIDDITEKREIQEKLKSSEKNFRSFFETMDDLIFVGNLKGEIMYTNQAVSKKLGYSMEELKGMEILDVHPDDKRDEAAEILKKMFDGDKKICPLPLAREDGSKLAVETKIWFGNWDGEEVIFAISKDLSTQQEALQKFNKLFENNPALMAVSTIPEGEFLEVNRAFLDKLGYREKEIIGKNSRELDLFLNPEEHENTAENLARTGQIKNKELKVKKKNGEILDGLFSGEIIESQSKKYFLTVMTDITKQKEAEKELVSINKKLKESIKKANEMAARAERANKLKSQFLANMSHEIRTPLNIIMGYTDILNKDFEKKNFQKYLNSIRSAGESLLDQVNDILDMSKIEAGMLEINNEYINLEEVTKEIAGIFKDRVDDKEIDFNFCAPEMPEYVKIDQSRFRQILLNLLDNAFKFTSQGHVSLAVKTAEKAVKNRKSAEDLKVLDPQAEGLLELEIEVEDTGIGIKEEKKAEIFNAFSQQEGNSTRKYSGTGLGLSITKSLINMMGGRIEFESKEGIGSKFTVYFPELSYKDGEEKKQQQEKSSHPENFGGAVILVVDDEELNRELLKIKLGGKNIKVVEAADGREAVKAAEKEQPDLVLMDLKMPVMDGYQAFEKIRQSEKIDYELPVIALTAAATDNEQQMSIKKGFSNFLSKPLVEGRLYELLEEHLCSE